MFIRGVTRVAAGAAAAAAGSSVSSSASSSQCWAPRGREIDLRPTVTNAELQELVNTKDDNWLLAERVVGPIVDKDEVYSTVHQLIDFGGKDEVLMLSELHATSSDDESIESVGHDADALMELAGGRSHAVSRPESEALSDMVYKLLQDEGVQRECTRVLRESDAFQELLTCSTRLKLPLALPYIVMQDARHASDNSQEGGNGGVSLAEILDSVKQGLSNLGRGLKAITDGIAGFFDGLSARLRTALRDGDGKVSDAERVAGGVIVVAVAVFSLIVLKKHVGR